MKYTVSKTNDSNGKEVWYCHMVGYSYIPVFGSIGSKKKALKIMRIYNQTERKTK